MPKDWTVNTKSAQAKARKNAVRVEEAEKKQKEVEDKLWQDDDKNALRKKQRKEEEDKKHAERLAKKEEAKKLLEEEMSQLKSAKPDRSETKITKFEIDKIREREEKERAAAAAAALAAQKKLESPEPELIENVNRIKIEGDVARDVDQAIAILNKEQDDIDLHPEKRLRAAYLDFETENLERLKKENPNLRLSQIRQMLKKDWQKSPKNPLNKIFLK